MTQNYEFDKFLGINFGFENKKFFIEYDSHRGSVGNLRHEFEKRAKELASRFQNLTIGISAGLDSQAVLHSFLSQELKINCAFLHFPGFNDIEYKNLMYLEKNKNFQSIIIEIDPIKCKKEILEEYNDTGYPPSQILQRKFLEQLPTDCNIMQGVHGPDLYFQNGKWYNLETANSFEIFRLRSFLDSKTHQGKVIGFERTSNILLSLLKDEIFQSFFTAYPYISNNNLIYADGKKIPCIDYWDLYLKPYIYAKYWKDELIYFPKYNNFNGIDYVMNPSSEGNEPYHNYRKNLIFIEIDELLEILESDSPISKRFYENYDNAI